MRVGLTATVAAALFAATPVFAAPKSQDADAVWWKCYDLSWSRGVHIEQNELPGWMNQCLAGTIPFSNAEPAVDRTGSGHQY